MMECIRAGPAGWCHLLDAARGKRAANVCHRAPHLKSAPGMPLTLKMQPWMRMPTTAGADAAAHTRACSTAQSIIFRI